jgi:hypothetical protein
MNTTLRRENRRFDPFKLFLLLGLIGLFFALTPLNVQADSNEATPVPTNTSTPLPSYTPEPEQSNTENEVLLPVVGNSNDQAAVDENAVDENAAPLPPADEQSDGPTSFIQSVTGVNQCLIGAIVLGLIAITVMVLYNVVQRIRT